jgi:hypothetical protein
MEEKYIVVIKEKGKLKAMIRDSLLESLYDYHSAVRGEAVYIAKVIMVKEQHDQKM